MKITQGKIVSVRSGEVDAGLEKSKLCPCLIRSVLGMHKCVIEQSAFVLVEGKFKESVGLDGVGGNRDGVEQLQRIGPSFL